MSEPDDGSHSALYVAEAALAVVFGSVARGCDNLRDTTSNVSL